MPVSRIRPGVAQVNPKLVAGLLQRATTHLTIAPELVKDYDDMVQCVNACTNCSLHKLNVNTARPVFRGELPCDILFLGDSNSSKDVVFNSPFNGDKGAILDELIEALRIEYKNKQLRFGISNLVKCIPYLEAPLADGTDSRAVTKGEVQECESHLDTLLNLAKPSVVILLGEQAKRFAPRRDDIEYVHIRHPTFILRSSERMYEMKKAYQDISSGCDRAGLHLSLPVKENS